MKNVYKIKWPLFVILLCLFPIATMAQYTSIPDANFEQALIDLSIDSDGEVNGQVLTSDIEFVVTLDLDHLQINDLTGIQDFAALEILNINGNLLTYLDVSQNIELKELYCSSDSAGFNMMISSLDLTNNANLEVLYAENLIFLETLNLKNGNNDIVTVELSCMFEGEPCTLTELTCVTVDDAVAATNNHLPYSNWYIAADFIYSEDCTLGLSENDLASFIIEQNPVGEILTFHSPLASEKIHLQILTLEGKLLSGQNALFEKQLSIDVSGLSSGLYFLKIKTEDGSVVVKKFLKE